MVFSLGVFSAKVGLGLGMSSAKIGQVALTYGGYLLIFLFLAMAGDSIILHLEPLLKKGPYLHAIVAIGFILWSVYVFLTTGRMSRCMHSSSRNNKTSLLLLVIPCPVCVTAMAYSTWAAMAMTNMKPITVGLLLSCVFLSISTIVLLVSRWFKGETGLGLSYSLFIIGAYFLLSLVVPSIIQQAEAVYRSFSSTKTSLLNTQDIMGTFLVIVLSVFSGFILSKRERK
jgi:predicted transporter